jgi:3-dehydroquinate synthase
VSIIQVHSKIRDYDVKFEESHAFIAELVQSSPRIFVVDQNVWEIYSTSELKDLPREDTIVLPIGEDHKNYESVTYLYDQLINRSAKKNLTMISIGGGILQDITGFAASTLYRGIKWIYVPTTLLAQCDSCIGGKTSLNYKGFKNLLGTFYPPHAVHIYTPFLKTLQPLDFFSGLGEVVKLHIIAGEDFTNKYRSMHSLIISKDPNALKQAITQALSIKIDFITADEFDLGKRNLLNFGHCFGHAVESITNFSIPHGQAVVIGMLFANNVSTMRGLLTKAVNNKLSKELLLPALFTPPDRNDLKTVEIINAMKKDKKRVGHDLSLIMLKDNYDLIKVDDLLESEVIQATQMLLDQLKNI